MPGVRNRNGGDAVQLDFHYYGTYCAAILAGWSHEDSLKICYSAQFVDCCSKALLARIKGPASAATTQLQLELMEQHTDLPGLQDMTRIWASFHFLPCDLYAEVRKWAPAPYRNKYRMICGPNGALVKETVELAKGGSLQAAGVAMHVLADTWAHRYFAGTPSLVINNTNYYFYELYGEAESGTWRQVRFRHGPSSSDDLEQGIYVSTVFRGRENSIMNLGHGRAGHLPDYSFMRYRYLPAWGNYAEVLKDNPSDYYHAFCQMIYGLKYLRGAEETFETERYDKEEAAPYEKKIMEILTVRRPDACTDWKAFAESLSGRAVEDFDEKRYEQEYMTAGGTEKEGTFLGSFIHAAAAQKSMVTAEIARSGNRLAGVPAIRKERQAG